MITNWHQSATTTTYPTSYCAFIENELFLGRVTHTLVAGRLVYQAGPEAGWNVA